MNRLFFIQGVRMIRYEMATGEGNLQRRFSRIASRILLLHTDSLQQDYKDKINLIKWKIVTLFHDKCTSDKMNNKLQSIKKAEIKKMLNELIRISFKIEDSFVKNQL